MSWNMLEHEDPEDNGVDLDDVDASLLFPPKANPVENPDGERNETIENSDDRRFESGNFIEKQCRICFGGIEDEEELGRLISPCVCNGSMRHVHVSCLNSWRTSSASDVAFWSCPQCGFDYHFARTRISGLATNKVALLTTTTALFLTLTTVTGHMLTLFLLSKPLNARSADQSVASILLCEPIDTIRFTPTSTAFEIIKDAIGVFARGELEDVLRFIWNLFDRSGHHLPGGLQQQPSAPKANWKESVLSFFGAQAATADPIRPEFRHLPSSSGPISALTSLVNRFLLGLSLVGSVSFLSLMFSMSLLPMLSMFNIFPGIATGRRRIRTVENTPRIGAFLIVGFVTVGSVRTFLSLYKTLSFFSMYLLARAETAILEVRPDGGNLNQPTEHAPSTSRTTNQ
ncbi:Protein involved in mRNA turnover and stability [Phaffia rhodozyma]|uniref:Protein involved in mRNA turnover and stability n=1 Tax=Phaffia rhodozyma TaxID=264483 RepID=A0A0F7SU06_PHARH|nr:Protein involved in mRNA turnover and stability [Phaffia rhodozyma]